ncbi:MAG TPA: hypothetical protein VNQ77_16950 [Frankiaceae bacterium]|nr:hypothetical protein [Frankiaceae bacterium]
MRRSPAAVVLLLALTACESQSLTPRTETREVERVTAEIVAAPPGVKARDGGPYCVLEERTGGEYGKPRYVVRVTIANRLAVPPKDAARKVFFELSVDAGGRRFDGLLSTETVRDHDQSNLSFVPPSRLGSNFSSLEMSAQDWAATQEVAGDLEACRLSIVDPDEGAKALGGRVVQVNETREWQIMSEDGTLRSAGLA